MVEFSDDYSLHIAEVTFNQKISIGCQQQIAIFQQQSTVHRTKNESKSGIIQNSDFAETKSSSCLKNQPTNIERVH